MIRRTLLVGLAAACLALFTQDRLEADELEGQKSQSGQSFSEQPGAGQVGGPDAAVVAEPGAKPLPEGMSESKRLSPDGTPIPTPEAPKGKEEKTNYAKTLGTYGAVGGGLLGAGLVAAGVVGGSIAGVAIAGAAIGLGLGWCIGKLGQTVGDMAASNVSAAGKIGE